MKRKGSQSSQPCKRPRNSVEYREIERRSLKELPYETFVRDYVIPGHPVILTDALHHGFAECSRWTPDFLAHIAGDESIQVGVFNGTEQNAQFCVTSKSRVGTPIKDVLSALSASQGGRPGTNRRVYLTDWEFGKHHPEMLKRYKVPRLFRDDIVPHMGVPVHQLKWLFLGEEGTSTPTHVDFIASAAWMILLEGRKEWRCVHRRHQRACRSPAVDEDGESAYCDMQGNVYVDLFAPDLDRFPDFEGVEQGWRAVQEAGEIIFNPSGIIHGVRNLTFCVALTHNFIDLATAGRAVSYFAEHYEDELEKVCAAMGEHLRAVRTQARAGHVDRGVALALLQLRADLRRTFIHLQNAERDGSLPPEKMLNFELVTKAQEDCQRTVAMVVRRIPRRT